MKEVKRLQSSEIKSAIDRLVSAILDATAPDEPITVIGVANGGVPFADLLTAAIQAKTDRPVHQGCVNITFHRDDIGQVPVPPAKLRTHMPHDINGKSVILADDVIFSGRSIRAALNELFDQGRPSAVKLAVLCDRGNRRLPLHPDFVGLTLETTPEQSVSVTFEPSNTALCVLQPES